MLGSKSDAKYERQRKAIQNAYDRIEKEKNNFMRLVDGFQGSYSGESHRLAVEVYSWQLLGKDILELKNSGKNKLLCIRILKQIKKKNPVNVLNLTEKLKINLERNVQLFKNTT